jgi:hypothetical protein
LAMVAKTSKPKETAEERGERLQKSGELTVVRSRWNVLCGLLKGDAALITDVENFMVRKGRMRRTDKNKPEVLTASSADSSGGQGQECVSPSGKRGLVSLLTPTPKKSRAEDLAGGMLMIKEAGEEDAQAELSEPDEDVDRNKSKLIKMTRQDLQAILGGIHKATYNTWSLKALVPPGSRNETKESLCELIEFNSNVAGHQVLGYKLCNDVLRCTEFVKNETAKLGNRGISLELPPDWNGKDAIYSDVRVAGKRYIRHGAWGRQRMVSVCNA